MMHHNSHPTHHPHIHPPIHPSLQQQHPPQHLGQQMPHHMPPNINHHSAAAGSHHGFPRDQMNRLGHHPRINHHQIHPNHGRVPKQQQQGAQQHNNSMMMGQQQVKGQQQNQPHGGINSTAGGVTSGATQMPPQQQHHQQKKQQQQQQKQIQQMQVPQNQNSQSSQRLLQTIETKPNPTTTNTSPTGPNIPTVSAATATPPAPLQENKPKIEISGPDVNASTSKEKSQQSATSETLANIKEKTPMCLVNELARHNKIQHQYRLTCEQGPAHKKKFTVILKLGEEEYTAEGPSIKKAQHSAAAEAISATKYKHPPTKTNRTRGGAKGSENHVGNITPTVELNALAMKRGEQTVYVTEHPMKGAPINGIPPPAAQAFAQPQSGSNGASYMAPSHPLNPHATSYSGHPSFGSFQGRNAGPQNVYPPAMSRFHNFDKRSIPEGDSRREILPQLATQFPPAGTFEPYRVTLTVGERQFVGVGNTQQAARHDAASRALEVLKPITSDSPNQDMSLTEDINAELKSPISLVHEMALKRNLTVGFEVKTEKGPPHMKIFVTICTVGTLKIQRQYRLTCEQGPAHKKKFTVILKLGEEEYTAEGPSIKKAQHSAAAEAISATKYKHPPTKTNRTRGGAKGSENHVGNITPTVELNALAMKRGEQTVYVTEHPMKGAPINGIPPPAAQAFAQPQSGSNGASYMAPSHPLNPHATSYSGHPSFGSFQGRNAGPQNVYPPAMSRFHNFDKRSIPGRGFTARNPPPMATQFPPAGTFEPYRVTLTVGERQFVGVGNTQQAARHDAASRALEVLKPITSDSPNQDLSLTEDINAELKSPISLVHEMALKRNLTVGFEVKTEKGPPHMKIFVTICTVGTLKKRAAEAMLEELKKLPPISPTQRIIKQKRKPQDAVKKKTRNLIKEKDDPEYHAEVNAISKLIQIQQSKKEKEPVYALAEERGAPRRREFVIEVMASGMTAVGVGSNKKLAKRLAAESLLALMGYGIGKEKGENGAESTSGASPSPEKSGKKVTYQERASEAASTGGSAGRQLVPGLLLMQQKDGGKGDKGRNTTVLNPHTTAAIAKEFLAGGTSPTADALTKGGGEQQTAAKTTINNNVTNEKTNETQSIEASHDQASTKMLTMLSELGLDNVHPVKTTQQPPSTPSVDETPRNPNQSSRMA
uniref:DRBM domain-containing protein n=1 Tax=Lutzomyia longipalpis TaxID=7200 RepID=A0A1B0CVZ0_LUTLO